MEGDEIGQGPEWPGDETGFLAKSISRSTKRYVVVSFLQLASIILESQQTVSCGHVRVDLLFPSPSPSVEWLHNDEEEPEALDFVPSLAFPSLLPQGLVHLSELQTGACLRRNC